MSRWFSRFACDFHFFCVLLSHLTGNQNSRQAALALCEAGWLAEVHHTLAWAKLPLWTRFLPPNFLHQLEKRCFPKQLEPFLHDHPLPEWGRLVAMRAPSSLLRKILSRFFSIPASNRRFDLAVARRLQTNPSRFRGVYGYFDTSLHTFRAAHRQKLPCVYELPTPYWRTVNRLMDAERGRRPEWAGTLPSKASLAASAAHRDEELRLADVVLVPSGFVKDSLAEAPSFDAPVIVVPYGCPEGDISTLEHEASKNSEPLRLLFAGTLSQSKGLADLLEAILPLGNRVSLLLAGNPTEVVAEMLRPLYPRVKLTGQLPHALLLEEMKKHDLLVMPTFYEGLSLVLLEAMSQGLPVLTTFNSGLDGLVDNGRHVLLVPPGDAEALRVEIIRLIEHPQERTNLAANALKWSRENDWAVYRSALRTVIQPWMA